MGIEQNPNRTRTEPNEPEVFDRPNEPNRTVRLVKPNRTRTLCSGFDSHLCPQRRRRYSAFPPSHSNHRCKWISRTITLPVRSVTSAAHGDQNVLVILVRIRIWPSRHGRLGNRGDWEGGEATRWWRGSELLRVVRQTSRMLLLLQ